MSQYRSRVRAIAMARSQEMARNAAHDGVIGAALGLLLVSGLVVGNLDLRDMMSNSSAPLASLLTIAMVVVAECAVVGGLCGVAMRKLAGRE